MLVVKRKESHFGGIFCFIKVLNIKQNNMLNKKHNIFVACISSGRPECYEKITSFTGEAITFFTRKGEREQYKSFGAKNIVEVDGNIVKARNTAILMAKKLNVPCLQLSDDLRAIKIAYKNEEGKIKRAWSTFDEILPILLQEMLSHGADYVGVGITDNALNYKENFFMYNKLIVNDFVICGGEVMFDEKADLKEDYDMFIRQIRDYGNVVVRADNILCTFPHRDNTGGANSYRSEEYEAKCNQYIMDKHKGLIIPHKRRPNQVEICYKKLLA